MISAALLLLRAINPRAWVALAAVVVLAIVGAALYHAGGNKPRAELAQLQASIKTAQDARLAEDARREAQHQSLLKGKDDERIAAVAAVAADWSTYAASLQHTTPASRASPATKPVPVLAERCNDTAGNQDVSAAVSKYRDDVRAAVAGLRSAADEFRDRAAGLLEVCDVQTGALIRLQDWAADEQQINH